VSEAVDSCDIGTRVVAALFATSIPANGDALRRYLRARFASGLLPPCYATPGDAIDTTRSSISQLRD